MKSKIAALAFALALQITPALGLAPVRAQNAPPTNGIDVVVSGFRNSNGQLGCRLFSSPEGYPRNNAAAMSTLWMPIQNNRARCFFGGVPAGTYSVTIFHDENSNKKFDYNWMHYPIEGYGFSNNAKAQFKAPSWDETSFGYDGASVKTIPITMIYR
ncbi:MAG TPA: DUF2141 domain-containing protein [Candidatus Acidoferrales bacterium]|nr:DUF2141 domain-containing protein [Candidatus Acidoferrales bacterium]